MRVLKDHSIAVIIDIQERLFPHIHEKEKLEQNILHFLNALNIIKIPVIVTEQYTKGLGPTIASVRKCITEYTVIEKTTFSCCDEGSFMNTILGFNPVHVLLAGVETHVCILQSAIDLLEKGFIPVVVEDCVSSRKLNDKKIALTRMMKEGAIISSLESVIFELLRYSGTDQFRAVSRLLK